MSWFTYVMTKTAVQVRAEALAYNHADLVRWSRLEDFDVASVEADINAGDVVIACGNAIGHHGATVVWAAPVVLMPAGSPLGEFAHIGDVVESNVRLPRQMPSYKAGEWWARKHFGTSLPIHKVDDRA